MTSHSVSSMGFFQQALATLLLASACATAIAQTTEPGCDYAHGAGAGPFDYRFQREMLQAVERRHFTSRVERLVSGESTAQIGPDLAYTLNKFPNHHRALTALSRLALRQIVGKVDGMDHSVNCHFERALRMAPNDAVTRQIYALHLGRSGRKPEAMAHLLTARQFAKDSAITIYNLGRVALELKDPAFALERAHEAAALGHPGTELREALQKGGHWVEPATPAPPGDAASAPESAASAPTPAAGPQVPASAPPPNSTTP